MEGAAESSSLCSIRTVAGCESIVDSLTNRGKYAAELLAREPASRPLPSEPKLVYEILIDRRAGGSWGRNCCGFLRGWEREHTITGL
jgi:hypothetical protein